MAIEVEYLSQNENLTDEDYSNFIDPAPVFSHGQLYVALSRVKRFEDIKIKIIPSKDQGRLLKNSDKVFTKILFIKKYCGLMEKWILFSTPVPITILLVYFLFIFKLGPMYMETRSPYKLKTVMRIYNVVQIVYNSSIVYHFLVPQVGVMPLPFLTRISCSMPKPFEGIDYLKSLYIFGGWHFQMLKILDLLDTVFMVLRKKNSHITFLHVYHHAAMVFFPWFSLRFIKATQGSIPVFINLIVHAVMYSYYFLTTFNAFKKYLWWKHHLTKLQLLQFVVILTYIGILYYNQCHISRSFTYIWLTNVFFIFCLFLNFYIKSYIVQSSDVKNNNTST